MMGRYGKRIAIGGVVAVGWLATATAWASGAPADTPAAPWAKAGLGTQVVATMVLWAGQKRHDDRLKVLEEVISSRPCLLKHCEATKAKSSTEGRQ